MYEDGGLALNKGKQVRPIKTSFKMRQCKLISKTTNLMRVAHPVPCLTSRLSMALSAHAPDEHN